MRFFELLFVLRCSSKNKTFYNKISNVKLSQKLINSMPSISNGNVWLWL